MSATKGFKNPMKTFDYVLIGTVVVCLLGAVALLFPTIVEAFPEKNATQFTQGDARMVTTISNTSEEIHETSGYQDAIVHLDITNPNNPEGSQEGVCSGTVVTKNVVLTAAHCITNDTPEPLTIVVTPALHRDTNGDLVRPYGTCVADKTAQPLNHDKNDTVANDLGYVHIASCSDDAGNQDTQLKNIGDRTGTIPIVNPTEEEWKRLQNVPIHSYGYPNVDKRGDVTNGEQLYELKTRLCGNPLTIKRNLGPNVLVWCEALSSGASGGPAFMYLNNQWVLISVTARKENAETTGEQKSSSGPQFLPSFPSPTFDQPTT